LRRILHILLVLAALTFAVAAGALWWHVYRPMPQLDGSIAVHGLQQGVEVTRDNWGVPHIRASSFQDMVEAQGYVMAQDRLWQMDLMRRLASGDLAEIFGAQALPMDRAYRTLGLRRAAERDVELLDPESRAALDAYARGVNAFIEQHTHRLPLEFSVLHYSPRPWTPADTLVITGYMYETLTNTWRAELDRAKVTELVGPERAKELFSQESKMDHFIVGGDEDAANKKRGAQGDSDDDDDDEIDTQTILKAGLLSPRAVPGPEGALWQSARDWLENSHDELRPGLGSSNWVISGEHTASGKPMLANDTHLELSVPSIWYEVHLTAPGWNVKGFTLPGTPLVIIGHNDRIAWGFTNNGADVQDLYVETFNTANPDEYRVRGQWLKAQIISETIRVKGAPEEQFLVVVTRHGPIVHREGNRAYALRWTALGPGALGYSYNWLGRARNWEEFRGEMKRVWGPGQNAVYADVDGNIGYIMAARVPVRKKGRGEVPVPGDTDDYEWTGYIPFEELPQALNPPGDLIATANARVVGPKYKPYLTDRWEEPFRTARIYDLLRDKQSLRPADFLAVQTDIYSYPHAFLADQLVAASKSAQPRDPRARQMLKRLSDWSGQAHADDIEPGFLDAAGKELLDLLLEPYLGKDTWRYQWRAVVFLRKTLRERPQRWLPPNFKSYDELLMTAADRAAVDLERATGKKNPAAWTWWRLNALEMMHPIGREGVLRWLLGVTGKPQAGTRYSIRAAEPTVGPSMRFVADLGNWDHSIMVIATGQSGQWGSAHYMDQFSCWYEGKPIEAPFSDAAVAKTTRHRLTLAPAR